uniref:Phospholysine phosphohistidine inorganic pyrophosphate phosphatase n=1 Tax=Ciona savignyi TaxID=51511 RepID=H2YI82_CIOSA
FEWNSAYRGHRGARRARCDREVAQSSTQNQVRHEHNKGISSIASFPTPTTRVRHRSRRDLLLPDICEEGGGGATSSSSSHALGLCEGGFRWSECCASQRGSDGVITGSFQLRRDEPRDGTVDGRSETHCDQQSEMSFKTEKRNVTGDRGVCSCTGICQQIVESIVIGKPQKIFFFVAALSMKCAPSECVMIGDDVRDDVGGAIEAGMMGMLVRSGKYRAGDEMKIGLSSELVVEDVRAAVKVVLASVGS